VLNFVTPIRVATAAHETQAAQGDVIDAMPMTRVVGILSGPSVRALLIESDGNARVVAPGELLGDGSRVVSIGPSSVDTARDVGGRLVRQRLRLSSFAP
jgi:hypothetical protein